MPESVRTWTRGVRTAIRNNASAYAYSVLITASFAAAQKQIGSPSVAALFLFAMGAAVAFAVVEASVSGFFRHSIREERSDVVVLGSALAIFSITAGLGGAFFASWLFSGLMGWFLASFAATTTYVLLSGIEFALAMREQKGRASHKRRRKDG